MEKSRQELKAEKQRRLLEQIVGRLADEHPSFYYLSTVDVAAKIEEYIGTGAKLSAEQQELMRGLDRRALQMLLSVQSKQESP